MTTFGNWCLLRSVSAMPAAPADVAEFVTECAPLGIEKIWPLVQEISRAHHARGFADPTAGGPVASAVNTISRLQPPRSWNKDEKFNFHALPYDAQSAVIRRAGQAETEMRRAQNEAADLRKQLEGKSDGTIQQTAA